MLLPSLIAVLILLAPIAYVAWRKLSVVEQEITFDTPQRGVARVSLIIQDDQILRLRIVYGDGEICEVFPAASRYADRPHSTEKRDRHLPQRAEVAPAASRSRPRLSAGKS